MVSRLYTTNQLAALFGVVPTTVIDWVERGKLEAFKTLGGHRRITHQAVLEFLEKNRLAYPPAFAAEAPGVAIWLADAAARATLESGLQADAPGARLRAFETLPDLLVGCGLETPRLIVLGPNGGADLDLTPSVRALRRALATNPPGIVVYAADEVAEEGLRSAGATVCVRRGAGVPEVTAACRRLLATR
jgi:excisionase family DNA binding protein